MKTQKNSVRRSLILSATALMISVAMLIGTTFAWFTDSVSSGKNKIVAGNLDVELEYKNADGGDFAKVTADTNVFKEDTLWEPGHVEYAVLKITNAGTLALKYKLGVNVTNETTGISVKNNAEFKLSDYLQSAVVDDDISSNTRDAMVAAAKAATGAGKLSAGYTTTDHLLATPDDNEKTVTLVVWMPEDVGNEANYKKDSTVPTIDLGINLVATQYAEEKDSFDNTYDASADGTPDNGAQWDGTAVSKTTVTNNSDNTKTVTMTIGNEGKTGYTVATVKGEASAIAAAGKDPTDLNLVITKTGTPQIKIDADTQEVEALDITVENKADNALVTITRNIGAWKKDVKVYHNGNPMDVAENTELTDGQYSYDSATGELKIASSKFSPFDITWKKDTGIETQEELNAAIKAGQTDIKLGAGEFTLYNQTENAAWKKTLTFTGAGADKTTFKIGYNITATDDNENGDYSFEGSDVTFKDMTIKTDGTGNFLGIVRASKLSFENCKIVGSMSYWGIGTSTFTNCEFADNGSGKYNLWLYSGTNVTFTGCKFNSSDGRFIHAYVTQNSGSVRNIAVNDCDFIGTGTPQKAAVNLKGNAKQAWNLVMSNCTLDNVAKNKETNSNYYQFGDGIEQDTTVTIDNKIVWQNGALVTNNTSES